LFLDTKSLLAAEQLFSASLMQSNVYPREVLKRALQHSPAAVIFAHNHPNGVGRQDIQMSL
jgi:DNA repair protein RadC